MNSESILRQLIWRHQETLRGLTHELVGDGGTCRLRGADGQILWSTREGECEVEIGGEPNAPASGEMTVTPRADSFSKTGDRTGDDRLDFEPQSDGRSGVAIAHGREIRPADWVIPLTGEGQLELVASPRSGVSGTLNSSAGEGGRLESLGELISASLESEEELDQLVEEHISNTNQLIALYNILDGAHEAWSLDDKLFVMIEEAGRQTGATLAVIEIKDDRHSIFSCWPQQDPERTARARQILESAKSRENAFIAPPPDSFVAAPIIVDDRQVGWLAVAERSSEEPFLNRDVKLLTALCDLTGGFLATARLQDRVVSNLKLEKELEIASRIQEMLIPRDLPEVEGLDQSATCVPTSSVGGDFYVTQELPDGRYAFALGDVTGKGVPAALIMAMTRTVFRALGRNGTGAHEILEQLSEVLYMDLEEVGKFVTILVGVFDPRERTIEIANGGHSPVLYRLDDDSPLQHLDPDLPPLGVIEEMGGESLVLPFPPGSVLIVTSDGITEARDPDREMYGMDRLTDLIESLPSAGAAEIQTRILESVDRFARGTPQSDDQTLLILRGRV